MPTTTMFYKPVAIQGSEAKGGWMHAIPSQKELEDFCKKTEGHANANGLRVVSITPIIGTSANVSTGASYPQTCGLLVVFEGP